jgi:hypothetical protein
MCVPDCCQSYSDIASFLSQGNRALAVNLITSDERNQPVRGAAPQAMMVMSPGSCVPTPRSIYSVPWSPFSFLDLFCFNFLVDVYTHMSRVLP